MSYIYVITNDINNKQYVGKTNGTIKKRFKEYMNESKREKVKKRPLYNAINKYGIEHFSIKQLEECDESIACEREQYWIQKLNTYGSTGYNATLGGDSRHYYNYQEIANKYLELQNQKETANFFHCDIETVKIACEQCNVKILHANEVLLKKNNRLVQMIDPKKNAVLKEFLSVKDASNYLLEQKIATGVQKGIASHIYSVCKNKRKTAYGYKWNFVSLI